MKVAILLPGLIRTYEKCFDNFRLHFKEHDCDIYSSIWNHSGNIIKKTYKNNIENFYGKKNGIKDEEDKLYKKYNFKKFEIENYDEWLSSNKESIESFLKNHPHANASMTTNGIFSQYYKIQKTYNLIENPNQYDLIVKYRYDIHSKKINFEINNLLNVGKTTDVGFPTDWYFFGKPTIISKVCNMYNFLNELKEYNPKELNKKSSFYTPEQILQKWIEKNNIQINNLKTNPQPIR